MFQIFLASFLVLKIMFLSSFYVGIEKANFKAYYNASIVRDTFAILATSTLLFQDVTTKNYFYISLGRTLLIYSV
jgi:hypothetical protein